jgi:2-polyprenyl-3-methyl-5-hydroxy-6-metoxy-1,4-benzoquinol methylase
MQFFLRTRDYNRAVSTEQFEYERCGRCGMISLANVPQDLGPYYVSDYHMLPASQEAIEAGVAHDQYKIDLVRRFVPSGRLLEVGPSWGAFCLLAKRSGFSVEAIEMDPACCKFLESRIGVRAICRNDEAAALAEAAEPDVIAAWHVLEHMRDPWRFIDMAARRLTPGGVLVLALPNPHAFQFRVLGRFWAHVDAPRHVHLVPPAVLRARAEAAGLTQVLCTTTDHGSLGWNGFGWVFSLPHLGASPFLKRALRVAGRKVTPIAALIEEREGAGAAYTAVFRKPPRST